MRLPACFRVRRRPAPPPGRPANDAGRTPGWDEFAAVHQSQPDALLDRVIRTVGACGSALRALKAPLPGALRGRLAGRAGRGRPVAWTPATRRYGRDQHA